MLFLSTTLAEIEGIRGAEGTGRGQAVTNEATGPQVLRLLEFPEAAYSVFFFLFNL